MVLANPLKIRAIASANIRNDKVDARVLRAQEDSCEEDGVEFRGLPAMSLGEMISVLVSAGYVVNGPFG